MFFYAAAGFETAQSYSKKQALFLEVKVANE
jgi:hypothetical protein